jgi:hypothetical protein
MGERSASRGSRPLLPAALRLSLRVRPLPAGAATVLAVLAFAGFAAWIAASGRLEGGFRIDEAHKLSETRYLALFLEGRVNDPEWFARVVDRTNPPVGKYVFGFAALLAGESLPDQPSLARASSGDDYIPPVFPRELSEPYLPLLRPARTASLLATSLTAALLSLLVARSHSPHAAVVALMLYAGNFLTQASAATAIFDPLLTLLTFAAVAASFLLRRSGWTAVLLAGVATGVLAALAAQTRLTGAIALPVAILLALLSGRSALARVAVYAAVGIVVFVPVAIAVNPYYWASPAPGSVPPRFESTGGNLATIAARVEMQYADMTSLLERTRTRTATLDGVGERVRFFVEEAGGDTPGLLLIVGLMVATGLLGTRLVDPFSSAGACIVFATALCVAILAWLPVAWPRYLLITIPAAAAAAGIGFVEAGRLWAEGRKRA